MFDFEDFLSDLHQLATTQEALYTSIAPSQDSTTSLRTIKSKDNHTVTARMNAQQQPLQHDQPDVDPAMQHPCHPVQQAGRLAIRQYANLPKMYRDQMHLPEARPGRAFSDVPPESRREVAAMGLLNTRALPIFEQALGMGSGLADSTELEERQYPNICHTYQNMTANSEIRYPAANINARGAILPSMDEIEARQQLRWNPQLMLGQLCDRHREDATAHEVDVFPNTPLAYSTHSFLPLSTGCAFNHGAMTSVADPETVTPDSVKPSPLLTPTGRIILYTQRLDTCVCASILAKSEGCNLCTAELMQNDIAVPLAKTTDGNGVVHNCPCGKSLAECTWAWKCFACGGVKAGVPVVNVCGKVFTSKVRKMVRLGDPHFLLNSLQIMGLRRLGFEPRYGVYEDVVPPLRRLETPLEDNRAVMFNRAVIIKAMLICGVNRAVVDWAFDLQPGDAERLDGAPRTVSGTQMLAWLNKRGLLAVGYAGPKPIARRSGLDRDSEGDSGKSNTHHWGRASSLQHCLRG